MVWRDGKAMHNFVERGQSRALPSDAMASQSGAMLRQSRVRSSKVSVGMAIRGDGKSSNGKALKSKAILCDGKAPQSCGMAEFGYVTVWL